MPTKAVLLLREKIFRWLGEEEKERTTNLGKAIGLLILFSVGLAVIATEPVARGSYGSLLIRLDIAVAVLFLAEYIARLWVAPLRKDARKGVRGALDYALTPLAILDLLAIAPTILGFVTPEPQNSFPDQCVTYTLCTKGVGTSE